MPGTRSGPREPGAETWAQKRPALEAENCGDEIRGFICAQQSVIHPTLVKQISKLSAFHLNPTALPWPPSHSVRFGQAGWTIPRPAGPSTLLSYAPFMLLALIFILIPPFLAGAFIGLHIAHSSVRRALETAASCLATAREAIRQRDHYRTLLEDSGDQWKNQP